MEALIKSIKEKVMLSSAAEKALVECLELHQFTKKEILIQGGEWSRKLYFVEKGAVRSFQNRDGKDITTWIYFPNHFLAAWDSFLNQTPSEEIFEVIADAILISIEYTALQALFKKYPSMEIWGRKLMEEYTVFYYSFSHQMRFATAQGKYDFFLEKFPRQPKVKLGQVASFLGMTQETLSRLRRSSKEY